MKKIIITFDENTGVVNFESDGIATSAYPKIFGGVLGGIIEKMNLSGMDKERAKAVFLQYLTQYAGWDVQYLMDISCAGVEDDDDDE